MPKFRIVETVEYVIEATTPDEAEAVFLAMNHEKQWSRSIAVLDREVSVEEGK